MMATCVCPLMGYDQGTTAGAWPAWNQYYVVGGTTTANMITNCWPSWNSNYLLNGASLLFADTLRFNAEAKRLAAKKRAQQLLKSTLSQEQLKEFDRAGMFELEVGDRLYRVIPGQRVQRLNKQTKKVERYFCIHTAYDHPVPQEDMALAQKLLLEADEAQFLKIANESAA